MPDKSDHKLTIARVFASPSLDGPAPRLPKLSPDGRYLAVLRNRADDKDRYDLWPSTARTASGACWSIPRSSAAGGS